MKKSILKTIITSAVIIVGINLQTYASDVNYLPYVTAEMTTPAYWADDNYNEVLMSYEEIEKLNKKSLSTKDTNMYNLKEHTEYVDGIALNESIKKSTAADAEHYLGWTYVASNELATQKDYDVFINNTQNPDAKSKQPVLYAVAVKRTELRTFPSLTPIWDSPEDPDTDYQYLVGVRVNEPLVITSVSANGKFYLAKGICCSGWVLAEDVAICKDKEEWLSAWDLAPENVLVVYGDKVYTENSMKGPETSATLLTMGTVLELADINDPDTLIDNRATYHNYPVWMPIRNNDGSYSKKLSLISNQDKVSKGYMPLTRNNIAEVALSSLGNTYGWGGSLNADDCSGFIRNIYKCFGIELARNTTWQTAMPVKKYDITNSSDKARKKILNQLPLGAVLFFNGHEMMYLGTVNGKYYVISAVGNIINPVDNKSRQRINGVVINTLDIKRANGNTWLTSLTTASVPYM